MSRLDRYTCEETFRRLDDYLDRELSSHEMTLVAQHLHTCAACAGAFTFEDGVLRTIRSKLGRLKAPPELQSAISQLIRQHQEEARPAGET